MRVAELHKEQICLETLKVGGDDDPPPEYAFNYISKLRLSDMLKIRHTS